MLKRVALATYLPVLLAALGMVVATIAPDHVAAFCGR
jgi:hypothetical protein